MAKKTRTKAVATPAKSLRKATKRAKVRAAPLLTRHAKKTTLARVASKKPRPADRRTPAELLLETIEEIRARSAMPASTWKLHEEPTASGAVAPVLDAKVTEVLPPMAAVTKPFEDLREMTEASRAGITAPGTGTALGAAHQVVDAMPRAARMTFMPLGMMVRQQALAFGLMLDVLQIQRQFFDMWRPMMARICREIRTWALHHGVRVASEQDY